ncbi:hypothetical protein P7C71_g462, partial [Lecanoromycetidae sp. Uapishka_2]
MSNKPIFVATHPRSCSTAFERVFMTCRDSLQCIHEPFGDAFYYGPERLSSRFEEDEKGRIESGFDASTFKTILDRIEKESAEGKRLFIKDIIHYLVPPNSAAASIAPSLARKKRGVGTSSIDHANGPSGGDSNGIANRDNGAPYPYATEFEPGNPTVIPKEILDQFHFTFLIRHPRYSIPSYYRCTVPPLDEITGFYDFMPSEAGYDEVRRVFDYLRSVGQVGPGIATRSMNGAETNETGTINGDEKGQGRVEICVVDADDLLDNPKLVIEAFCKSVGINYNENMLKWDSEEDHQYAREAFEKWRGFHEDAINSTDLKPRMHKKKIKSTEEEDAEWREKFGVKGAKVIRETVDKNVEDYEYMKQFCLKV